MNYVVVCVSQAAFPKGFIAALSEGLAKLRLKPGLLTEQIHGPFSVIKLQALAEKVLPSERIKAVLEPLAENHQLDILCVTEERFRTPIKLIAFDMDSTIIAAEVIDEMATTHGVGAQVKAVTVQTISLMTYANRPLG